MKTRRTVLGAAMALAAVCATSSAHADDKDTSATPDTTPPARISPSISAGAAFVAVGYEEYGVGITARVAADARLRGRVNHRIGAALSLTRFSITGAELDLPAVEATYRVYPVKHPVYISATAGIIVAREAFSVSLPRGRSIDDTILRVGAPVGASVGVTLFRHIDVEVGYRHSFFFGGEGSAMLGHATLTMGGRW